MTHKQKTLYQQLVFWTVFWFIQSLLFSGGKDLEFYLAKNIVIVGLQAIISYLNWHLLLRLIAAKRYLIYALLSVSLVYLIFSFAFTLIDKTLSLIYPTIGQSLSYKFQWVTSFWSILSGSAPYSIALLGSTVFWLIKENNSLKEVDSGALPTDHKNEEDNENTLMLKEGKVIHRLPLEEILFVQGMKEYVRWHTKDKKLITLHTLANLEDQLGNKGFLRTHKSFIVNTKCVNAIRYDSLEIPGTRIPIGRSYRSRVQDCFQSEI
ncbi:LytR/AlgR family response regulator transcription factor [Roseivirga misakiensis]|uniref:HTH LytTR-type domain-containing protein n=1 Tax=Roseivirga misakiensis TaxID=1563681 RepID=A0A1E5T4E1_9BACT|nr:LytTR family DNA-binding domain-containing protein [Roseivirga misakiensis]OEK06248.1 hypothetical protein BFP71_00810 [Roseivirga misakiensis]